MAITEFFAGVAVADFRAILPWYERLFGKPPDFRWLTPRLSSADALVGDQGNTHR